MSYPRRATGRARIMLCTIACPMEIVSPTLTLALSASPSSIVGDEKLRDIVATVGVRDLSLRRWTNEQEMLIRRAWENETEVDISVREGAAGCRAEVEGLAIDGVKIIWPRESHESAHA